MLVRQPSVSGELVRMLHDFLWTDQWPRQKNQGYRNPNAGDDGNGIAYRAVVNGGGNHRTRRAEDVL